MKKLSYILFSHDTQILELFLAFCSLGWGLVLIAPWWDTFLESSSYTAMAQTAPEWLWGVILTLTGLVRFIGLAKGWLRVRQAAALMGAGYWAFVSANFFLSGNVPTGVIIYAIIAFFSGIVYIRLFRERQARKEDREVLAEIKSIRRDQ